MNEERVKQRLIAAARELIYDAFSLTEDFDNVDAFEDLLADSFGGHAGRAVRLLHSMPVMATKRARAMPYQGSLLSPGYRGAR